MKQPPWKVHKEQLLHYGKVIALLVADRKVEKVIVNSLNFAEAQAVRALLCARSAAKSKRKG